VTEIETRGGKGGGGEGAEREREREREIEGGMREGEWGLTSASS
jgi:hypothetical protein